MPTQPPNKPKWYLNPLIIIALLFVLFIALILTSDDGRHLLGLPASGDVIMVLKTLPRNGEIPDKPEIDEALKVYSQRVGEAGSVSWSISRDRQTVNVLIGMPYGPTGWDTLIKNPTLELRIIDTGTQESQTGTKFILTDSSTGSVISLQDPGQGIIPYDTDPDTGKVIDRTFPSTVTTEFTTDQVVLSQPDFVNVEQESSRSNRFTFTLTPEGAEKYRATGSSSPNLVFAVNNIVLFRLDNAVLTPDNKLDFETDRNIYGYELRRQLDYLFNPITVDFEVLEYRIVR